MTIARASLWWWLTLLGLAVPRVDAQPVDKFGPLASWAGILEAAPTNRVQIFFDDLDPNTVHSATDPSILTNGTFRVVMLDSSITVAVSNATYTPPYPLHMVPPGVLLTLSTTDWHYRSNYFVVLNNIRDGNGNSIAPNSIVPITWPQNQQSALPASAAPVLTITRDGPTQVRISWPTNAYSYALDWTTSLTPTTNAANWCEAQPGMSNPYFTTPEVGASRFFRLRKTR